MKDLKYLAALTIPLSAIVSISISGYWTYFTVVYAFVIIPLLELILPLDAANFDTKTKERKAATILFDWMLYANIPIVFGLLGYFLWSVTSQEYATYELLGLLFSMGIVLGTNGINVAHELGHRLKTKERFLRQFYINLAHNGIFRKKFNHIFKFTKCYKFCMNDDLILIMVFQF